MLPRAVAHAIAGKERSLAVDLRTRSRAPGQYAESPIKLAIAGIIETLGNALKQGLADRAGFEPAVAVTPRTLSKRVP